MNFFHLTVFSKLCPYLLMHVFLPTILPASRSDIILALISLGFTMSLPLSVYLPTSLLSVSSSRFLSVSGPPTFSPYVSPDLEVSLILFLPSFLVSLSCHVTESFTRQMCMSSCLCCSLSPK